MNNELPLAASTLARGRLHRIEDGRGRLVQCLGGRLWLTQEGERRDIVLEAGDEAPIEHDGLTILSALRDSRYVVLDARAPSAAGARVGLSTH